MKRRRTARRRPLQNATASRIPAPTRHTTVPASRPSKRLPPPPRTAKPTTQTKPLAPQPRIPRIVDEEPSLLDLIDNLLEKGVVLNADLILSLANVDLVYVRLSALLCGADRVMPVLRPAPRTAASGQAGD
jgi:hypothetical protein